MICNLWLQIQIFTVEFIVELFFIRIYPNINILHSTHYQLKSILQNQFLSAQNQPEPTHELYQFDSFYNNNFFQIKSKTSDCWLYWKEDPMRNYKMNIQTRNSLSTAWAEANNFPGGFFLRTYFFTTDPFEPTSIKYVGLDCPCPN